MDTLVLVLPRFNNCCGCLSLRTGVFMFGYFSIVSSFFYMIGISSSLYKVHKFVENESKDIKRTPEDIDKIATSLYIVHAYFLFVFLYHFVNNVLLVYGTHRDKTKYMKFYFKSSLFLLGLALALVVMSTIFMGFIVTGILLVWCAILLLSMIVVRSAYLEIDDYNNRPKVYEMVSLK